MGERSSRLLGYVGTSGVRSRLLRGNFTVPAVAYDGSTGGLSADGGSLVLITPRRGFPRAKTTFKVLDATLLQPRKTLTLRGDFSFDALSPDRRWIYLIEYTSPVDSELPGSRSRRGDREAPTGADRRPAQPGGADERRSADPPGKSRWALGVHALSLVSGELSLRDPERKAVAVVDTLTFEPATPASAGRRWTIRPSRPRWNRARLQRAGRALSTSLGGATSANASSMIPASSSQ